MHQIVRSLAAAAALTLFVPSVALAQAKAATAAPAAAPAATPAAKATTATTKKAVKPANEARWASMLASAATLTQEGMEIKRIDAKEKAEIDAFLNKIRAQITTAKQGGLTEAEEDQIDQLMADVVMGIANRYEDKAPPKTAAKK